MYIYIYIYIYVYIYIFIYTGWPKKVTTFYFEVVLYLTQDI